MSIPVVQVIKPARAADTDSMISTLHHLWQKPTIILILSISLLVGAAAGYLFYSLKTNAFIEQIQHESESLQRLTSSYVSEYSRIRREVNSELPVPAEFRADAHIRFNDLHRDDERIKALMVGMPGKAIRTAPTESKLIEQLQLLNQQKNTAYQPISGLQAVGADKIFRSVFPSVASEPSCANCHNQLQNGTHRWRQGDLMGAYVIDKNIGPQLSEMKVYSIVLAALTSIALFLASVVYQQYRKLVNQSDRLKTLANTDPLTKCHNRRSLISSADRIFRQEGSAGGLLMVDVDHFKDVNDTYGHDIGDQMLVHISNIVRANIRTDDILARVGGEEFVVYLPGCDRIQSIRIANRICYSVAQQPLKAQQEKIPVTVSVGLVQMRSTKKNIFLQWLGAADRLLYKAKNAGRNQVCYVPEAHVPYSRLRAR